MSTALYLSPAERESRKASPGRLRFLGGNIGLACPIAVDVIDDAGEVFGMGLDSMLPSLAEFEGSRGGMTMADNLAACCFEAHKHGLMTAGERALFEDFVREKISTLDHHEAARRLVLGAAKP